ncbi:MAG: sigma-70 family RNA polymerase sigma factor [Fuerstiella sp.]
MRLFTSHYSRLFSFVIALQPNLEDADDIMQEVSMRLWDKFDDFTPDTNFLAWSRQFVRHVVMNHRSASSRSRLLLDDELIAQIAYTYDAADEWLEMRRDALAKCVAELPTSRQSLLRQCLHRDGKLAEVANVVQCTVSALYKRLDRIRVALETCVGHRLRAESTYSEGSFPERGEHA